MGGASSKASSLRAKFVCQHEFKACINRVRLSTAGALQLCIAAGSASLLAASAMISALQLEC